MPEVVSALIGAVAVICIPIIAWLFRRSTREGRLLLRVERLGSAHSVMPDSPEKLRFAGYLVGAVNDLNSWLDPENRRRRKLIRRIFGWTYAVGVIAVLLSIPVIDDDSRPWLSSTLGIIIGTGIAVVTMGSSFIIERNARLNAAKALKMIDDTAASERMEAVRRGEASPAKA